jgi:hypothetical protein
MSAGGVYDSSQGLPAWSDQPGTGADAWLGWAMIALATVALPLMVALVVLKAAFGIPVEVVFQAITSGNFIALLRPVFDTWGAAAAQALQQFGPLALIVIPLLIMLRFIRGV